MPLFLCVKIRPVSAGFHLLLQRDHDLEHGLYLDDIGQAPSCALQGSIRDEQLPLSYLQGIKARRASHHLVQYRGKRCHDLAQVSSNLVGFRGASQEVLVALLRQGYGLFSIINKEGIAATEQPGILDAGADIRHVPLVPGMDFFEELEKAIKDSWPKPKMLVINFPGNPTTQCVELEFFEKVVAIAREHKIWVVHDIAYAEIVFDGYKAPSILEVEGAKDVAVEFYSLSKTYNMPGWRVGFMVGNQVLVAALARMKSYLDYGMFTPIQVASIAALEGPQDCVNEIREMYQSRRDALCDGLNSLGWAIEKPKATMFVWAPIPEQYRHLGSLEFSKKLLEEAKVAVSPGIGFGDYGDDHVRFGLIENEHRTRQAIRGIREMFRKDGLLSSNG